MTKTSYSKDSGKTKPGGPYHSKKMIGNITEGQGYADKRKRKVLNSYKKLIHKSRRADSKIVAGIALRSTEDSVEVEGHHKKRALYTKNAKGQVQNPKKKFSKAKRTVHSRDEQVMSINRYTQAEQQRQWLTKEHQQILQDRKARREAREEALRRYREKKEARHKMLSKRTPRGQPIIKYHMDYLLQNIASQTTS
ncbi:thyroid transcription factor 1-associated protein 26-like [Acanthaster planci]|uniref:Thyroid transcription factor 1-associated protein 26-like n=1 Tax=Acanthaster planci TaxID=133434 RepID=A0A8B7ZJD2_ACAPL|nr:thyroid transcription factor 1-associated protein 26-like [Acanthaster planci]